MCKASIGTDVQNLHGNAWLFGLELVNLYVSYSLLCWIQMWHKEIWDKGLEEGFRGQISPHMYLKEECRCESRNLLILHSFAPAGNLMLCPCTSFPRRGLRAKATPVYRIFFDQGCYSVMSWDLRCMWLLGCWNKRGSVFVWTEHKLVQPLTTFILDIWALV